MADQELTTNQEPALITGSTVGHDFNSNVSTFREMAKAGLIDQVETVPVDNSADDEDYDQEEIDEVINHIDDFTAGNVPGVGAFR